MLIAVAIAGAVVALALVAAIWVTGARSRQVGTMVWPPVLGRETPAIANLVANDFRVTRAAVAATLLDLAARGFLSIEQVAPASYVCRLRAHAPDQLTVYEQQVFDTVEGACVDRVVPVEMLTRELDHQPRAWMTAFRRAVIKEARDAALVESRWSPTAALIAVFGIIGAVVAVTALFVALVDDSDSAVLAAALAWVVVAVVSYSVDGFATSDRQRGQWAGREAAARWQGVREQLRSDVAFADLPPTAVAVWKRYLAYGVALGAAHAAAIALPLGDDDGRTAWSAATGHWRRVRIRYPRWYPPAWGRDPRHALIGALVVLALAGPTLLILARPGPPFPSPPLTSGAASTVGDLEPLWWVVSVAAAGWAVVVITLALFDLGETREVTGFVVRVRPRRGPLLYPEMPRLPTHWFVALDPGEADRLRAYRVRPGLYDSFDEGEVVTVAVTRRLGYVRSVS